MKLIDVLVKLANGEIKNGTKLKINGQAIVSTEFTYNGLEFTDNDDDVYGFDDYNFINEKFLNEEVKYDDGE